VNRFFAIPSDLQIWPTHSNLLLYRYELIMGMYIYVYIYNQITYRKVTVTVGVIQIINTESA
jgi:hypothetical protein